MYNYSDSKQRRFHQNAALMGSGGQYFNALAPHPQFSHNSHQRGGSYGGSGIGPLENMPPGSAHLGGNGMPDPILEDYDEHTSLR
jgi:hypothetical protein